MNSGFPNVSGLLDWNYRWDWALQVYGPELVIFHVLQLT